MNAKAASAFADLLGQMSPMASLPSERREAIPHLCVRETVAHNRGEFKPGDWPGQAVYLGSGQIRLDLAVGAQWIDMCFPSEFVHNGLSAAAFLLSQRGLQESVLAGGLRERPSILPETINQ